MASIQLRVGRNGPLTFCHPRHQCLW